MDGSRAVVGEILLDQWLSVVVILWSVGDVLASVDTGGVTLAKIEAAGAATVMHPLLSIVRRPLSAQLHEEMFALLNARLTHAAPPSGQRQTQQQGTQYTAGVSRLFSDTAKSTSICVKSTARPLGVSHDKRPEVKGTRRSARTCMAHLMIAHFTGIRITLHSLAAGAGPRAGSRRST